MIKFENHSNIKYSVTTEVENDELKICADMNASIKTKNDLLEVGNDFIIDGVSLKLVKSVRQGSEAYYRFEQKTERMI